MYLADTSIWSWADRTPGSEISDKLGERLERGEVATCPVVVLEALHRARTPDEYTFLFETFFAPLVSYPVSAGASERAIEIQRGLAESGHGNHRRPAADLLLAAAAEEAGDGVVLWFYDKDLRVICEHTAQPYEAEPGD